jgi:hypothetical protein
MKVVKLWAISTGRLYPPGNITHICSRLSRQEEWSKWKIPVTPSGIEPATFQLVTQCLNQLRYRVYPTVISRHNYLSIPDLLQISYFVFKNTWRFHFVRKGANTMAENGDMSGDFIRSLARTRAWQKPNQVTLILSEIHFLATACSASDIAVRRPCCVVQCWAVTKCVTKFGFRWLRETAVDEIFHEENEAWKLNFTPCAPRHTTENFVFERSIDRTLQKAKYGLYCVRSVPRSKHNLHML